MRELSVDDFPIVQINLIGGNASERSVYQTALTLRDDIESIPRCWPPRFRGEREEVLEVVIDPDALNTYRISSEELLNTLQRNNRLIPAGGIDTGKGRFSVKVPAVVEQAADILNLPIRSSGDTIVTLQDVSTVRRTFRIAPVTRLQRSRGHIDRGHKRADANVIKTVYSRYWRWWTRRTSYSGGHRGDRIAEPG